MKQKQESAVVVGSPLKKSRLRSLRPSSVKTNMRPKSNTPALESSAKRRVKLPMKNMRHIYTTGNNSMLQSGTREILSDFMDASLNAS